jgi:hypothetical protein
MPPGRLCGRTLSEHGVVDKVAPTTSRAGARPLWHTNRIPPNLLTRSAVPSLFGDDGDLDLEGLADSTDDTNDAVGDDTDDLAFMLMNDDEKHEDYKSRVHEPAFGLDEVLDEVGVDYDTFVHDLKQINDFVGSEEFRQLKNDPPPHDIDYKREVELMKYFGRLGVLVASLFDHR